METLVPVRRCCDASLRGFISCDTSKFPNKELRAIGGLAPRWMLRVREFEDGSEGLDAEHMTDEELQRIPGFVLLEDLRNGKNKEEVSATFVVE